MVASDWIEVQKDTFSNWINHYLKLSRRHADLPIDQAKPMVLDLFADLRDGYILRALLEVLTGSVIDLPHEELTVEELMKKAAKAKEGHTLRRPIKRRLSIAAEKNNLETVFTFMHTRRLVLFPLSSQDIAEGDEPLTLSLIWMLIMEFKIGTVIDGYEQLLDWVNTQLSLAGSKLIVTNFTDDWQSGTTMCALCEAIAPGSFSDWQNLDIPPKDKADKALDVALAELGVPRVIKPEYFTDEHLDEFSVMTYLAGVRDMYLEKYCNRRMSDVSVLYESGSEGEENFSPPMHLSIDMGRMSTTSSCQTRVSSPFRDLEKLDIITEEESNNDSQVVNLQQEVMDVDYGNDGDVEEEGGEEGEEEGEEEEEEEDDGDDSNRRSSRDAVINIVYEEHDFIDDNNEDDNMQGQCYDNVAVDIEVDDNKEDDVEVAVHQENEEDAMHREKEYTEREEEHGEDDDEDEGEDLDTGGEPATKQMVTPNLPIAAAMINQAPNAPATKDLVVHVEECGPESTIEFLEIHGNNKKLSYKPLEYDTGKIYKVHVSWHGIPLEGSPFEIVA